jgi:hypothetical protein
VVRRSGFVASVAVLAGCLSVPTQPQGLFPCPDGACPTKQVCGSDGFCHPAAGGSSSGGSSGASSSGSSGSTSSGSSSGGSSSGVSSSSVASSAGTTSSSSSGSSSVTTGSSSSGSSGGSSSTSAGPPLDFSGTWDMDWGSITMAQTGSSVQGVVQQWGSNGYGTLTGTATGDAFVGGWYWSFQSATTTGVFFALGDGGTSLAGTWGGGKFPWCGVRAGNPLYPGCGWSDTFMVKLNDATAAPVVLTQTADEVVGTYDNGDAGISGLVSAYRLAGVTTEAGAATGKFSFWWSTPGNNSDQGWTELAFLGNWLPANGTARLDWCGTRQSSPASFPLVCLGGGDLYDGTWITNLGLMQLDQAIGQTEHFALNWSFWGAGPGDLFSMPTGNPNANDDSFLGPSGASWDSAEMPPSPAAGATNLLAQFSDGGLVISGQTGSGQLWCGAQYFPDPYNHQDPLGTLPPGCGLTNQWTVWQQGPDGGAVPVKAALTQVRGLVVGSTATGIALDGGVLANPAATNSNGVPLVFVTGNWSGGPGGESGTFSWYPTIDDQSFLGDFSAGAVADAGAWCGTNDSPTQPTPCFE